MEKVTCSLMTGCGRGGGVGARSGVCGDERARRDCVGENRLLNGRRLRATWSQCWQVRMNELEAEDIDVFRIRGSLSAAI